MASGEGRLVQLARGVLWELGLEAQALGSQLDHEIFPYTEGGYIGAGVQRGIKRCGRERVAGCQCGREEEMAFCSAEKGLRPQILGLHLQLLSECGDV